VSVLVLESLIASHLREWQEYDVVILMIILVDDEIQ
jgi:hypothetical protein